MTLFDFIAKIICYFEGHKWENSYTQNYEFRPVYDEDGILYGHRSYPTGISYVDSLRCGRCLVRTSTSNPQKLPVYKNKIDKLKHEFNVEMRN